jgi:hypothetical protein
VARQPVVPAIGRGLPQHPDEALRAADESMDAAQTARPARKTAGRRA